MKRKAFAATLATLFTTYLQADTVGLFFGSHVWQSKVSGVLGEKNNQIDFNLLKEQQTNYFIAVEHPFPWLPNARIAKTTFDTTGQTFLTQAFSFGGKTFAIDADVEVDDHAAAEITIDVNTEAEASINISYLDYTLYYQLFDNDQFSINLGLTVRDINGAVNVIGTTTIVTTTAEATHHGHIHPATEDTTTIITTSQIVTDDIVPMLYLSANAALPIKGLTLFVQSDLSLMSDHSLSDYQLGLNYDLINNQMMDINLTLGYRVSNIAFENLNNLYTDVQFDGAFIGLIAHF